MTLKLAFLPWFALPILSGLALADGPPDDAKLQAVLSASYDLSRRLAPADSRYYHFESAQDREKRRLEEALRVARRVLR